MESKPIYTTGEAAKWCHVNLRTILRWIERGELPAYQLPGRGDNRIRHEDLVAFMHQHGMPLPTQWGEAVEPWVLPSSTESKEPALVSAQGPASGAHHPPLILVVDDDPYFSKALQRIFKGAGYATLVAHNGVEAGALLAQHQPALMTVDLHMPGMTGEALLHFVSQRPEYAAVRLLVVSAATTEELIAAKRAGAHSVIPKPFANADLLDVVAELLNPRR